MEIKVIEIPPNPLKQQFIAETAGDQLFLSNPHANKIGC